MADLIINDIDASEHGVAMGDGFVSSLIAPIPLKDMPEYDARTQHGKQVLIRFTRFAARELTLTFVVYGDTETQLRERERWLIDAFNNIQLTMQVPAVSSAKYRLLYTGKSINYSLSLSRTISKISAKFIEPNPTDR